MIQLALHILNDFCLENLTLLEDLFHRHSGNDATSLTLDDTLDDILDMASTSSTSSRISLPRQNLGIILEGFRLIIGTDSEDSWQGELKLLNSHGLQSNLEIERTDRDDAILKIDHGFFLF